MENENAGQSNISNNANNLIDNKQGSTIVLKVAWALFIILAIIAIVIELMTLANTFYLTLAFSSVNGIISILYRIFLIASLLSLYFLIRKKLHK